MSSPFHIFVCARGSDGEYLQRNLLRSPAIEENKVPLSILWNQKSASIAFRNVLEGARAQFLIFTHCDVFFPQLWFERLEWEIERLTYVDPNWAVAGISGKTSSDELVGRMWDASLDPITKGVYGKELPEPVPIVSTDELAFIVRKGSAASFDPLLPNFHLYATDVILTAEKNGQRSYGLDIPLIHNAKAQLRLGKDYVQSYRYMARKWRKRLPVPTTCGPITANPVALPFRRLRIRYKAIFKPATYSNSRISDPRAKAVELGLDHLLAPPDFKKYSRF
jgi:hypothetical protein